MKSNRVLRRFLVVAVMATVAACQPEEPQKSRLYLTTNSGYLYQINLQNDSLSWVIPGNSKTDELTYFTLKGDKLFRAFLDGQIIEVDKKTGKINWTYQDSVSPNQSYYGYDFSNVRFCLFGQYPAAYRNALIFGNSHGEFKSIDAKTRKVSWTHQISNPIIAAPKLLHDTILANLGYDVITLNANDGKNINRLIFTTPIPTEPVIDKNNGYVVDEDGDVFCLNGSLSILWKYHPKVPPLYLPENLSVVGNSIVYGSHNVTSLDKNTGKEQWCVLLPKQTTKTDQDSIMPNGEHHTISPSGDKLLSVESSANELAVNTPHYICLINKNDGNIIRKKYFPDREIIGQLKYANGFYYYLCSDKILYKIDGEFTHEQRVCRNINFTAERGLQDTYMAVD